MTLAERIRNINRLLENNPRWFGQQPIRDDTPENIVIMWETQLGTYRPPYVPTFRIATGFDGQNHWPLPDSSYFATMETAKEMARRWADRDNQAVTEVPFGGTGGIFSVDIPEFHITVNGQSKNAGLIASAYLRNPEDKYPGVAAELIRQNLYR